MDWTETSTQGTPGEDEGGDQGDVATSRGVLRTAGAARCQQEAQALPHSQPEEATLPTPGFGTLASRTLRQLASVAQEAVPCQGSTSTYTHIQRNGRSQDLLIFKSRLLPHGIIPKGQKVWFLPSVLGERILASLC